MAGQGEVLGKCSYASVFVGVYVMIATHSVATQWGNMSVYVLSYFNFRVGEDMTDSATWMVAANFIGWNFGMLSCEKIVGFVGHRGALVVVTLMSAISTSLTFLSIQHSFVAFLLTYPFLLGISFGIGNGLQLMYCTVWASPRYHGVACCSIFSVNMVGSLVMNLIATGFINPKNLSPDFKIRDGIEPLFSYPELLDRVPHLFLVHGAIALALLATSFALIREKHENKKEGEKEKEDILQREVFGIYKNVEYDAIKKSLTNIVGLENSEGEKGCEVFDREKDSSNCVVSNDSKCSKGSCVVTEQRIKADPQSKALGPVLNPHSEIINTLDQALKNKGTPRPEGDMSPSNSKVSVTPRDPHHVMQINSNGANPNPQEYVEPETNQQDVTPKQALRTKEFYALFIMTLCSDACYLTFFTYYKIFGMLYFPDDYLFAGISVSISLMMIVFTTLVGLACDTLGVKNTLVACSATLCVMVAFFYVSVLLNKWLYSCCVVLLMSLNFVGYHITTFCCIYYFGKSHGTTLCGMAMSVMYVSNTAMPFLVHAILNTHTQSSWHTLFTVMNIFPLTYLLAVVFGLPAVSRVRAVK